MAHIGTFSDGCTHLQLLTKGELPGSDIAAFYLLIDPNRLYSRRCVAAELVIGVATARKPT